MHKPYGLHSYSMYKCFMIYILVKKPNGMHTDEKPYSIHTGEKPYSYAL